MPETKRSSASDPIYEVRFESYGVLVSVKSNNPVLMEKARAAVGKAMVGQVELVENSKLSGRRPKGTFQLLRGNGRGHSLFRDGQMLDSGLSARELMRIFGVYYRILIAEHAPHCVFIHAGAVGWKGRGIVIPASSNAGKTTLVAELVKRGADYYSDEYAVLDRSGHLRPFARGLTPRTKGRTYKEAEIRPETIGTVGRRPLQIGMLLLTEFKTGAKWEPEFLSPGQGIVETIAHTVPIRANTEFSLKVLNKAFSRAIIAKSPRGEAKLFAKILLNFLDDQDR